MAAVVPALGDHVTALQAVRVVVRVVQAVAYTLGVLFVLTCIKVVWWLAMLGVR